MKRFLIFLFVLLTAQLSALDIKQFVLDAPLQLTYGINVDAYKADYKDFSQAAKMTYPLYQHKLLEPGEGIGLAVYSNSWYATDFAEEPFDGIIEVLVVGEPLPSTTTTILIALGFLVLVYCKQCYHRNCSSPDSL